MGKTHTTQETPGAGLCCLSAGGLEGLFLKAAELPIHQTEPHPNQSVGPSTLPEGLDTYCLTLPTLTTELPSALSYL